MKVPSIIIVVAAALALAVPSGFAATARTAPELGQSGPKVGSPAFVAETLKSLRAQLKILTVKNAALVGKNKGLTGSNRALIAQIGVLQAQIVDLLGRLNPPKPLILPDDCESSGNNCTPERECAIWGSNCNLVERSSLQPEKATESSSSNSETTTDGPVAN